MTGEFLGINVYPSLLFLSVNNVLLKDVFYYLFDIGMLVLYFSYKVLNSIIKFKREYLFNYRLILIVLNIINQGVLRIVSKTYSNVLWQRTYAFHRMI